MNCCLQYHTDNPQSMPLINLKPKISIFLRSLSPFMGFDGGKLLSNLPEAPAIHITCHRVQIR